MKIIVCVKHVPDAQSSREIVSGRLVRGQEDSINDLDEHAVQAALDAKTAIAPEGSAPDGTPVEIVAVSMGPVEAKETLRRALQMGADRAVLVSDEELAGSDVIGTAQVLAAIIRKVADGDQIGLVISGAASADGMTSMLPGALAEFLDIPCLGPASGVEFYADVVKVTTFLPSFQMQLEAKYPALIYVNDEVNHPAQPGFKQLLAAKKKPLEQWDIANLDYVGELVGIAGSGFSFIAAEACEQVLDQGKIVTDSGDGGKQLAEYLKSLGYSADGQQG